MNDTGQPAGDDSDYALPPRRRNLQHFAGSAVQFGQFGLSEVCDPDPALGDAFRGTNTPVRLRGTLLAEV